MSNKSESLSSGIGSFEDEPKNEDMNESQLKDLAYQARSQHILQWNYKKISALPSSLMQEASEVRQIHLKHNLLIRLPDNLGCLVNLTYLHLYGNNLVELPNSIGDLPSLQVLDVSNNCLCSLPTTIGKLKRLRSMSAAYNELCYLPEEMCNLGSLSILMLTGNHLKELPKGIKKLRGLQGLYIDHNYLRTLPDSLVTLPLLAHVSCCHNYLEYLPAQPFVSCPTVYFDNNPGLSYLAFTLLKEYRQGDGFDPIVLPAFECFHEKVVHNNMVMVGVKTHKTDKDGVLIMPYQLRKIDAYYFKKKTVPPLCEICLKYVWSHKTVHFIRSMLVSRGLPQTLEQLISSGPFGFCDFSQCRKPLFMYTCVVVIVTQITSHLGGVSREVPVVIYFCSGCCAAKFFSEVNQFVDNFSLWLRELLKNPCTVHVV